MHIKDAEAPRRRKGNRSFNKNMRLKEVEWLRPLTEFEGFVTKMYLIVLKIQI